ncbi:iron-sulfur assembly protein IscA, chloroplastic isoform X2 [Cryptomeria japonica]|uniref:iron-sulfur assembly protein IscA, chloroplastic isoform X2 n=1 Tax=Cryptomeria japonica TaxID=3369 RepID=UPI0027D9D7C1|nr:iron-sulfur assembly protein IscA, chloroplastic isoform X2 [Cryptomeria japonica]
MASALITFNSIAPSSRASSIIGSTRSRVQIPQGILRITANPVRSQCRVSARRRLTSVRAVTEAATVASESLKPAILLSENALKHLNKMRAEKNEDLCLRIGVRQGGCSGMSYIMDFEQRANTRPDDSVINYDGFTIGLGWCLKFDHYS